MNSFSSVKSKVLAFTCAITLPFIIVAFYNIFQNYTLTQNSVDLEERQIPFVIASSKLSNLINRTTLLTSSYLMSQSPDYKLERSSIYDRQLPVLLKELFKLSDPIANNRVLFLLNDIEKGIENLKASQDELLMLVDVELKNRIQNLSSENQATLVNDFQSIVFKNAAQIMTSEIDPALKEINKKIALIVVEEESLLRANALSIKEKNMNHAFAGAFFLIVGIIGTIVISFYLLKSFEGPINKLKNYIVKLSTGELPEKLESEKGEIGEVLDATNSLVNNLKAAIGFSEDIGKGNFDSKYQPASEKDILGNSLVCMKNQLVEIAEVDRKQNWVTEGLAKFSITLRNNDLQLKTLCDNIISDLVKYVKANQGGIFLLDKSESGSETLNLISCYAYEKKKFIEKTIEIGEGLIGQTFLERETIYMTQVPESYVQITSGLGEATPTSLLIVPLIVKEQVEGILELASFQTFEKYEISFIEKLAENIASVLASVKIAEKTNYLLDVSQKQALVLLEQEEEMRQNLEELQATQEEVVRKSEEFEEFNNIVNSFTIIIDLSPEGIILDVNQRFSEFTGYPRTEIIGKNHTYYVPDEAIVSGAFEQLWNELSQGKNIIRDVLRKKKDGSLFWLRASYLPVYDKSGKIKKISCLCFDITKEKVDQQKINEKHSKLAAYIINLQKDEKTVKIKLKELEKRSQLNLHALNNVPLHQE